MDQFIINHCAAILLAAGASTRLGRPKQLLQYNGKSLINGAIDAIEEAHLHPVITVLGANASSIAPEINSKKVLIITNPGWQEGIASSIRMGITIVQEKYPSCDGAVVMVCDQPFMTGNVLLELIRAQRQSGKPIAACSYDNITGTPVLFHQSIFPELILLKGDKGAGNILKKRLQDISIVPFPMGKFDIDTTDDYQALKNPPI